MLQTLGLTAEADAVYRTMLGRRDWRVQDIARHLELTETQVRAALDRLAECGLLHSGNSGLSVVHPSTGLTALLAQAEAEVDARRHQLEATRAAIAAIAAEHSMGAERDFITRLEGIGVVRDRLRELAAQVQHECISFNPNVAQTPDAKQASKPLNQELLERGVGIRCVYQDSFRNDPDLVAYTRWLTSFGGRARTVPAVPMMMVIFDRTVALLPLDPADSSRGAVEVNSPALLAALTTLFEQVWSIGTDFGKAPPADAADLDPSQLHLLRLLAAGQTDEAAARSLGVSLSTVRRMMAVLMDRLAARSRFQAGVHASQKGWLSPG
jgi:DNA-binding CsgD family transcriptional regulator/predicted DNA-binding transcriptional regulator